MFEGVIRGRFSLHQKPLLAVAQGNRWSWEIKIRKSIGWANMQICTSPADLPPILRWAFWSSKNSLVAVRSETRFSSSAILFLSWWFSSWIWRKCQVGPSWMSEKSSHHVEGVRWGSPKNFWRTIHVSQAPGNLPYPRALIFSPSFHWTASSLKHATLLLIKIASTAPSIAKGMRSSPWTGLEFTDTKKSKSLPCDSAPDKSSFPCHTPWHSRAWTGTLLLLYICPDRRKVEQVND